YWPDSATCTENLPDASLAVVATMRPGFFLTIISTPGMGLLVAIAAIGISSGIVTNAVKSTSFDVRRTPPFLGEVVFVIGTPGSYKNMQCGTFAIDVLCFVIDTWRPQKGYVSIWALSNLTGTVKLAGKKRSHHGRQRLPTAAELGSIVD